MLGPAVASGRKFDMAGRGVLMNTHGIHPGQMDAAMQMLQQQQLQQQVAADSMAPLFGMQPMTQVNASGLNQSLLGMPPAEN
ncbi:hypothetical protein V8E36_003861 [Tilletia maclaganii]